MTGCHALPRQRTHSAPKLCPVAVRWGARKQSHGPCTALERLMRSSETVDLWAGSTVNWHPSDKAAYVVSPTEIRSS